MNKDPFDKFKFNYELSLNKDWVCKFAALLLCEQKGIDCKELVTVNCLKCDKYFCSEHHTNHLCKDV